MNNYLEQNQTGIIKGIKVQCLPVIKADAEECAKTDANLCEFYNCAFSSEICYGDTPCAHYERPDKTSVYFKKVEKMSKKNHLEHSEALEKFALEVCEMQRSIIKNEVIKFANRKDAFDVVATIENSGYPNPMFILKKLNHDPNH